MLTRAKRISETSCDDRKEAEQAKYSWQSEGDTHKLEAEQAPGDAIQCMFVECNRVEPQLALMIDFNDPRYRLWYDQLPPSLRATVNPFVFGVWDLYGPEKMRANCGLQKAELLHWKFDWKSAQHFVDFLNEMRHVAQAEGHKECRILNNTRLFFAEALEAAVRAKRLDQLKLVKQDMALYHSFLESNNNQMPSKQRSLRFDPSFNFDHTTRLSHGCTSISIHIETECTTKVFRMKRCADKVGAALEKLIAWKHRAAAHAVQLIKSLKMDTAQRRQMEAVTHWFELEVPSETNDRDCVEVVARCRMSLIQFVLVLLHKFEAAT